MEDVIAQYRSTSPGSLISQSTLSQKPISHHAQPQLDLLPLKLRSGHSALVAIAIQSLTSSEWPGCVFFAAGIRAVHCCCGDVDILKEVGKQISSTISLVYPQVTIDVSEALRTTPLHRLPEACPLPAQFSLQAGPGARESNENETDEGSLGARESNENETDEGSLEPRESNENEIVKRSLGPRESNKNKIVKRSLGPGESNKNKIVKGSLGPNPTKKEIAEFYADKVSCKIKDGLKEIRKCLKKGGRLIDHLSGEKPLQDIESEPIDREATYDVIEKSFLNDGKRYKEKAKSLHFFTWYATFNAGALDSIVTILPSRRVAHSETNTATDGGKGKKDNRKRKGRRDLARLTNTIVHRLPSYSQVIYVALGVKNYKFTVRHGLSDGQLDYMVSRVLENLVGENLTILEGQAEICNPARAISERTNLDYESVKKALLEDISNTLKLGGMNGLEDSKEGENEEISPPLTPQASISTSSSSRYSSPCSPEYAECDPTRAQPDIHDKVMQDATVDSNPGLGKVAEIPAAAALPVDHSARISMVVPGTWQNSPSQPPFVDGEPRGPENISKWARSNVDPRGISGASHGVVSSGNGAFGSSWVPEAGPLDEGRYQCENDRVRILDVTGPPRKRFRLGSPINVDAAMPMQNYGPQATLIDTSTSLAGQDYIHSSTMSFQQNNAPEGDTRQHVNAGYGWDTWDCIRDPEFWPMFENPCTPAVPTDIWASG